MDTSALVAAVIPAHPQHGACRNWLSRAKQGAFELVISAHSIAELYAVLTRMPARPRITGATAAKLIDDILKYAKTGTLSARQYQEVVDLLAHAGLIGGVVYDGIIAKVAECENVDHLLTLNEADFRRLWPSVAALVSSPQTLAPP